MEPNNSLEQPGNPAGTGTNLFELQIDQETMSYLGEMARWAKFLAIVGFVVCALIVIFSFFAGSFFGGALIGRGRYGSSLGVGISAFLIIIYSAFALLYFFPCLYTFNFAKKMQIALRSNDQVQLNASFRNLKSCYKFMGILTIIVLSFYALALVFGIIAAAFR